jgi:VWFA-related protein
MKKSNWLVLMTVCVLSTVFAQQPKESAAQPKEPQKDDAVRLSVTLVQIDVVVTDKNGRSVEGLKKEDFEILENGRPQQITNLSYVSQQPTALTIPDRAPTADRNAPPLPSVGLRPEQVRRTIALVVDDLGMSFDSMHDVREALKKFVDEQMQPGDLVAIIRVGGGMGALQQFTSDKKLLYAAIERVRWSPTGDNTVAALHPIGQTDPLKVASETAEDPDAEREAMVVAGRVGALTILLRGLADIPGRKSVILFSDGLPLFGENRGGATGNEVGSMVKGNNGRALDAVRRLTDLANRASAVIYTVDARGLQALTLTAADVVEPVRGVTPRGFRTQEFLRGQDGLNFLAQETGGFFMPNLGDLSYGVRRVLDDQKGYYLIGYIPSETTFKAKDGRQIYHKIEVKAKRSDLKVRSRKGFYGVPAKAEAVASGTPVQKLSAALTSPFTSSDVGLRLTSLFGNDKQEGPFVRSLLHIDASGLTFTEEADGWRKTVVNLIAATFNEDGLVQDPVSQKHTVRIRGEYLEHLKRDGLIYEMTMSVKQTGIYQLRVALQDAESQRVGSANQFIEVPDLSRKRLTLSGLIVSGKDVAKANKPAPAGQTASKDEGQLTGAELHATPAVRKFRHGMRLDYAIIIYNAALDRATNRPQVETQIVLHRDGKPVYTGQVKALETTEHSDLKQLVARGVINLGTDLRAGEYLLQMIVTDKLAKEKYRTVTRWIDFDVVK